MSQISNSKLKKAVEAILFISGNSVSVADLVKVLEVEKSLIESAVKELQSESENRGVIITEASQTYQMATHPDVSSVVKNFLQAQLREKLTEAAIETLAIITYKQPIAKAEIEAIRGVNSQYILKLLLQRGLIEKVQSQTDARVNLYQTTHEFLHHLGIKKLSELPDFDDILKNISLPQEPKES